MALVATKVVVNSETLEVISADWHEYDGVVHLCKGPSKDEMKFQNAIEAGQLNLQQQQLALQQGQFNQVNPTLQAMIQNGGLTPQALAALQAQTINALPNQFNQLYGQVGQELTARGVTGGQMAGGGDIARQFGSLGAQEAGLAQQGQFNIAQLQQQGLLGALGTSLGIGQQYGGNVGTFGSGASAAGGSATSAANAATQATTGLWGSLFGALGSVGGGFAQHCWVARAIYGEFAWQPIVIWDVWSNRWAKRSVIWRILAELYGKYGERFGRQVRNRLWLKRLMTPIFDWMLRKALEG